MTNLTKKNVKFHWSEAHQEAFQMLKDRLCSEPVLAYPTADGFFILDTDASNYGIGAVLSQVQAGNEEPRVIAYASKTLSDSQRAYCTTWKELLAVVYFVKHFQRYLYGRRFLLRTDHAALVWLLNFKNPEGIVARWITALTSYMPFDCIQHRPGREHTNADSMSRIPECNMKTRKCPKTHIGCPSCYPEDTPEHCYKDLDGPMDITASLHEAVSSIRRSRVKKKKARKSKVGYKRKMTVTDEETLSSGKAASTKENQSKDGKLPVMKADFSQWPIGWDPLYLKLTQQQDPTIGPAYKWVVNGKKPEKEETRRLGRETMAYWTQFETLSIYKGILYRKYQFEYLDEPIHQLALPECLWDEALGYCHNALHAGHQGEKKTADILRRRFYWPGYRKSAKFWCRSCDRCQRRRPKSEKRAPLFQLGAGNPNDCVAMDLLGPFDPPTDRGNRYILVISDIFSKWTTAYAIPNKEAATVCKAFTDHANKFGYSRRIHSDRGTEFQNELVNTIATTMGIEQTRTTAYRPQSDGQVERFNRTLIKMLKSFVADFTNCTTWDELLPMLTSAYNATEHTSTGCTPNLLYLGREVNLPVDVIAGAPPRQKQFYNYGSYATWLHHAMSKAYEYARNSLQRAATRQKLYYDRKSSAWKPKLGEWVYYFYPPYARFKLGSPWTGPYVIVKELTARTYLIAAGPDAKPKVVHQDNLKSVLGRFQNQSNWVKEMLEKGEEMPAQTDIALSPEPSDDEEERIPTPASSKEETKKEPIRADSDGNASRPVDREEDESDSDEENDMAVPTTAPVATPQKVQPSQSTSLAPMSEVSTSFQESTPVDKLPNEVQRFPEVAETSVPEQVTSTSEVLHSNARQEEVHVPTSDGTGSAQHQVTDQVPTGNHLPVTTSSEIIPTLLSPIVSDQMSDKPVAVPGDPHTLTDVPITSQNDTTFERFWLDSHPEIESDSALLAKYPVPDHQSRKQPGEASHQVASEVTSSSTNIPTTNQFRNDDQALSHATDDSLISKFEKLCINDSVPASMKVEDSKMAAEQVIKESASTALSAGSPSMIADRVRNENTLGEASAESADSPVTKDIKVQPPPKPPDEEQLPRRSTRIRKPPERYGYRVHPVHHV
jgi:transposase InsO family protein